MVVRALALVLLAIGCSAGFGFVYLRMVLVLFPAVAELADLHVFAAALFVVLHLLLFAPAWAFDWFDECWIPPKILGVVGVDADSSVVA